MFQMFVKYNSYFAHILKFIFLTHISTFSYQDGFIDIDEFERLIDLLYYYNDLYKKFQQLDKNNDKRISFSEFKKGHEIIGLKANTSEKLREEFNKIDTNHGGYILFDEVRTVFDQRDIQKYVFKTNYYFEYYFISVLYLHVQETITRTD